MLEIRNLTKRYGKTVAVDGVSLRLEKQEFFCLLGPSGCGKSTILRMIAGFENQDAGEILLNGKDISRLPPYRRDVNMVFQNYALFPHLNVYGNVAYGLRIRKKPKGEIRERVTKALAQVELPGYDDRMPSQLSGGQKQRVALARALVNEPSVLLLDEPMSALDKKISEQMRRELKDLQKQVGITFVYVTHNQTEALALADRVAVMNAGRVEQAGTPRGIYESPDTVFTAGFIGSMNFFPGTVRSADEGSCRIDLFDACPVTLSVPGGAAAGDKVLFCLRPERLKLSLLPPEPYENALQGEILGSVYLGETTVFDIRLNTGDVVSVNVQNYLSALGEGFFEAGEAVNVLWSRTSGRVIHA
ncbi:MAG: ABC transporter ATP-binding protein [Acidobacteria bacterium]|nr:ABC transporter ATP-binding protein [Acidobacteriota bacterium]